MTELVSILVTLAVLAIFPIIIFWMLVRAVRDQGTRWWGIIILLSILTCYCTTIAGFAGLIAGSNAAGTAAMERHYCEQFRDALARTETLPDALALMDAAAASDAYQVREPNKDLRFRFVWLLGGCFLFAGANLMLFSPGRRGRRHPADCIVMILAALVVFLTGIWQIAWGNGYAYQAGAYRRMLTGWHDKVPVDATRETNGEIAARLSENGVNNLNGILAAFLELSGEKIPGMPVKTEKTDAPAPAEAETGPGIAIIGGADGPTAVFVGSELLKKHAATPAEKTEETDLPADDSAAEDSVPD